MTSDTKAEAPVLDRPVDGRAAKACQAYVWGLAPLWAARIRQRLTQPTDPFGRRPPSSAGAPLNRLGHQRILSDPRLTVGVAPNVDTLYSLAWLDLDTGPFHLRTPDFGGRYHSFQFGTADTECRLALGSRTHGSALPPLFVHAADDTTTPPPGALAVPVPTRYVMVAGRVMVDPHDDEDLAAVHALQARMELAPGEPGHPTAPDGGSPVPGQTPVEAPGPDDGLRELREIGAVLRDWVPLPHEVDLLASWADIGLRPGAAFDDRSLTDEARTEVLAGLDLGRGLVDDAVRDFGDVRNGWAINHRGPVFGTDYLLRAAVAREQVYVLPPEEALYPTVTVDEQGAPLDGARSYELAFGRDDLPPVDAFWSLTLYTREGRLVPNVLDRYAIGDRTPDLRRTADGGLRVVVSVDEPADDEVTWLPAPPGPFRLMLRLYNPRTQALDGTWSPPPIRRIRP